MSKYRINPEAIKRSQAVLDGSFASTKGLIYRQGIYQDIYDFGVSVYYFVNNNKWEYNLICEHKTWTGQDITSLTYARKEVASIILRNFEAAEKEPHDEKVQAQAEDTQSQDVRVINIGKKAHANGLALSSDGNFIASGCRGQGGKIRLWNIATGDYIRPFEGHEKAVWGVAFSQNGKLLVSGSHDRTLRLWNVETGKCIRVFRGHKELVLGVSFVCKDKFIVSGSGDGTLRSWNTDTGECVRTFRGHENKVNSVAFSSRRNRIVSCSDDGDLRLWDIFSGLCIRIFGGYKSVINSVAFSHDEDLIVSGSSDKTLKIWNTNTGECIKILRGHEDEVNSVAFSHDDKFLISGSYDSDLRLWCVDTGKCIKVFKGHEVSVDGVAFSPDDKSVISISEDETLRIWKLDFNPENDQPCIDRICKFAVMRENTKGLIDLLESLHLASSFYYLFYGTGYHPELNLALDDSESEDVKNYILNILHQRVSRIEDQINNEVKQ